MNLVPVLTHNSHIQALIKELQRKKLQPLKINFQCYITCSNWRLFDPCFMGCNYQESNYQFDFQLFFVHNLHFKIHNEGCNLTFDI